MDRDLVLSQLSRRAAENAILLTGSARSGTTIMGRLLASCKGIEYGFEPPLLVSLFASGNLMPKDSWRLIYDTYIYEELLIGSLAGRYINTNLADDSSVYQFKSKNDICERLSRSSRKQDLEHHVDSIHARACYKIPNVLSSLDFLVDVYPSTSIVVMRRKALPTITSLLRKGWFSNGKEGSQSARIYPFTVVKTSGGPVHIPYWVVAGHETWWLEASVEARSMYYYIINTPSNCTNFLVVDYENLLLNPFLVFESLSTCLGLHPGELTNEVLLSIAPQTRSLSISDKNPYGLDLLNLASQLPQDLRSYALERIALD